MWCKPFFLQGHSGACFCVQYSPHGGPVKGKLLVVQAFAEELNKSRRMVTLLAQLAAQQGYITLIVDTFGTGDSAGSFEQAEWAGWQHDIVLAANYLNQHDENVPVTLLGIRLGALLALTVLPDIACQKMLVWQPIWAGKQQLNEFLRLHVVARMMSDQAQRTVTELKAQLASEGNLDVAGYGLTVALFKAIEQADWQQVALALKAQIHWIDIVLMARQPSPRVQRQLDYWRESGASVSYHQCVGAPFWNSLETKTVASLSHLTVSLL